MSLPEITCTELQAELAAGKPLVLLDVREEDELQLSRLDGITHIPMNLIPQRLAELDPNSDFVVICRVGARSGRVTEYLLSQGFRQARNLVGGMNEWVRTIDPTMTIY